MGIGAPGTFDQWTYGVKDVLTKIHGAHAVKLGGEVTSCSSSITLHGVLVRFTISTITGIF